MSIFGTLFNSGKTLDKATDAIISTGDKLFYTDEEKADDRARQREFFPKLLQAYAPFKIAQRLLALWFSFLFGLAFIIGLSITLFNMITTYRQTLEKIAPDKIITISLDPLFALVSTFSIGTIMITIVGFYFFGGTIESYKGSKNG